MKDKKLGLKTVCALLISVILITASISYVVFSAGDLSYDTVIEQGSQNIRASYIIFKDDSTYYARNGQTGAVTSNTNFTALFISVRDAASYGAVIHIKEGNYSGRLVLDCSNLIVEGAGVYSDVPYPDPGTSPSWLSGTVIKPASGEDGIHISGANLSNIQIRNLGIWFTTASTGHGITTDVDQAFHLRDAVIENIIVLDHDKSHYALRFANFLFLNVRHVMAWGGNLIEIYANLPGFQQGNSVFDDLFGEVLYDLTVDYTTGPYPIFIRKNDSVGDTWTNLLQMRRLQMNNPTAQTDSDYKGAVFWALRTSTISDLDLEGVASTANVTEIGSCTNVLFDSIFTWAQGTNVTFSASSNNNFLTFVNAQIHGHVIDGNLNDIWVNPYIVGDIKAGSEANFLGLKGNSGYTALASGQTSKTVTARYIGAYSVVLLTMCEADSFNGNETLKVESIDTAANSFVVKSIDEGTASTDIGFFWMVKHYEPS